MTDLLAIIVVTVLASSTNYIVQTSSCLSVDVLSNQIEEEVVEEIEPFYYEFISKTGYSTYISVDSSESVLLVGDSRTVGFHQATKNDDFSYIARVSMGYEWLSKGTKDYKPRELICAYIEANPEGIVVFNLGINDPGNKEKYAEWITELVSEYPDAKICYLSINPVSDNDVLDEKATSFNSYVKDNTPSSVKWLDSNNYLKQIGFSAWDGVHYDPSTYRDIFKFLEDSLNSSESLKKEEIEESKRRFEK